MPLHSNDAGEAEPEASALPTELPFLTKGAAHKKQWREIDLQRNWFAEKIFFLVIYSFFWLRNIVLVTAIVFVSTSISAIVLVSTEEKWPEEQWDKP